MKRCVLHILFTYLDPYVCSTVQFKARYTILFIQPEADKYQVCRFCTHVLCVCVYHVLTMNYYNADTSKQPQTDPQAKYSGQLIKYSYLQ